MHIMQALVGCQKRSTKSLARSLHPSGAVGIEEGAVMPTMLRRAMGAVLSASGRFGVHGPFRPSTRRP